MVKKKKKAIARSKGDLVFDILNYIFMLIFMFIMLYPLYFTVIVSVSDINQVGLGNVYLFPRGFTLDAYRNILVNDAIWTGYKNTIIYTVLGTLYGLAIMLPLAYALSKKHLFGSFVLSWFFLFTMFFRGGIVPSYLLMKQLNLINNPLVMIVGGISVYNLIVSRTFFQSNIPEELYDSAKIDGANEFKCFFNIALPLSRAIVAVMALYLGVSIWNSYFSALIYITKKEFFPLQLVLRSILIYNQQMSVSADFFNFSMEEQQRIIELSRLAESMKYAIIFIASAPLLAAYPFIQKFFVKGIMVGSIKG